jgi:hypothetical protein
MNEEQKSKLNKDLGNIARGYLHSHGTAFHLSRNYPGLCDDEGFQDLLIMGENIRKHSTDILTRIATPEDKHDWVQSKMVKFMTFEDVIDAYDHHIVCEFYTDGKMVHQEWFACHIISFDARELTVYIHYVIEDGDIHGAKLTQEDLTRQCLRWKLPTER